MLMPSVFGENLFDDFFNGFPFYDDREMRNTEKKLYGKVSMGVVRSTYVIDEHGVIEKVFEKAKPDTNAAEILAWLNGEKA